jgi:IclR family acetate operon transcriptional repressor
LADPGIELRGVVPMPAPRRDRVQSLDRALDVLEALAGGEELGVSEVAARTGLVVSTAHRLLAGLADRGYVAQNRANGRYALGFKVLELAGGLEARTSMLRAAARPHLEALQRATGETTNLVILDADRVIYIDQVEGTHSVRMFTELGSSALAHTTGSGKAILAYRETETIEKLYPAAREPFERLTERTLTTSEALRDDFVRIRRRGYALDSEEHEVGVTCVATPVFDAGGAACGALSISGPTARMTQADAVALGRLIRRHATLVSAALGYHEAPGAARADTA